MEWILNVLNQSLSDVYIPNIHITDVAEIIIIAYLVYHIMVWIKNTKAWMLLKGILMLSLFILLAAIFQMHTILWLARNSISVLAIAAIVVFQPELRRALEKLGQNDLIGSMKLFDRTKVQERFTGETIEEIIDASFQMGRVKTGALIVVEQKIMLTEYENTGIELDCKLSRQVLINIFEHNTPLHDGAIIVRGNRIVAATCYLPLSENTEISKELGTRHRAALGMSEVSDALVVVVSEETGYVSIAYGGKLERNVSPERLHKWMEEIRNKKQEKNKIMPVLKGRRNHEK